MELSLCPETQGSWQRRYAPLRCRKGVWSREEGVQDSTGKDEVSHQREASEKAAWRREQAESQGQESVG